MGWAYLHHPWHRRGRMQSERARTLGKPVFSLILHYFLDLGCVFGQMLRFFVSKPCFLSFSTQNHYETTSKRQFWSRNVRNWTTSLTSDMSGPAKASTGGQILVSKAGFSFFCSSEITPFQFLLANLSFSPQSYLLFSKFVIF